MTLLLQLKSINSTTKAYVIFPDKTRIFENSNHNVISNGQELHIKRARYLKSLGNLCCYIFNLLLLYISDGLGRQNQSCISWMNACVFHMLGYSMDHNLQEKQRFLCKIKNLYINFTEKTYQFVSHVSENLRKPVKIRGYSGEKYLSALLN